MTVSREPDSSTGGGRRGVESAGMKGRGSTVSTSVDLRGRRRRGEGEGVVGGVSSTGSRPIDGGSVRRIVRERSGAWQDERRYILYINTYEIRTPYSLIRTLSFWPNFAQKINVRPILCLLSVVIVIIALGDGLGNIVVVAVATVTAQVVILHQVHLVVMDTAGNDLVRSGTRGVAPRLGGHREPRETVVLATRRQSVEKILWLMGRRRKMGER